MYFIKAPCNITDTAGYELAPDFIKESYDYDIKQKLFENDTGYKLLYKYILNHLEHNLDKIITIGGDESISYGTVLATNQIYDNLKILWLDSELPNILPSIIKSINPSNILFVGLNNDCELNLLDHYDIKYLTSNKIKQNNVDIINMLLDPENKLHVIFNIKVLNELNKDNIYDILNLIKNNVIAFDLVDYNPNNDNDKSNNIKEICRNCLVTCFDLKEKSINIFNENTEFLIYRPLMQQDPRTDIGWDILRGLKLSEKEQFIKNIDDNQIISIDVDGQDYLVTKTTMEEQNKKTYLLAKTINDIALFPQEKESMMFELIN